MSNLFFLVPDSAFYWVRYGTLESVVARGKNIFVTSLFSSKKLENGSILVFNRFTASGFYQAVLRSAIKSKIPFIVDVDDLFWDLPEFSNDPAKNDPDYSAKVDYLCQSAAVITTTNRFLKEKLALRYADKKIVIVPNARPNWYAPRGAVLIANTDSLKFDSKDVPWFLEILHKLSNQGVPIQLIGSNDSLMAGFDFYSFPQCEYDSYLSYLQQASLKAGIIPVAQSDYANAKSDIKVQEYLGAGLPTFASNISPYQEYKQQHPESLLCLVDNTRESWQAAADKILSLYSAEELSVLRGIIKADSDKRAEQFAAWLQLLSEIEVGASKKAYRALRIFIEIYVVKLARVREFAGRAKRMFSRTKFR